MKLEVMLSVMDLKKEDLDKMNITSKCTVINQRGSDGFEKYKNFNIYSYNELGNCFKNFFGKSKSYLTLIYNY